MRFHGGNPVAKQKTREKLHELMSGQIETIINALMCEYYQFFWTEKNIFSEQNNFFWAQQFFFG